MRTSFQVLTYVGACALGAGGIYLGHDGLRSDNAALHEQLANAEAKVARLSGELNTLRVTQVEQRRSRLTQQERFSTERERQLRKPGSATDGRIATLTPLASSPGPATSSEGRLSRAGPTAQETPQTEEERVQQAQADLHDYLERTENLGVGARMRQSRRLLEALRERGDAGTLALLRTLEEGTTSRERQVAAALLGGMDDVEVALPVLNEIIASETDVMVRRGAARGLRIMDSHEAVPALSALAENTAEDRFVRYNAALGLARLSEPAGVDHLVGIYNEATNTDGTGRYIAFRALTRLDDPAALPAMRVAVVPGNGLSYRVGALKFMARHGTTEDLPLVQSALDDPSKQPALLDAARDALRALGGTN